MYSRTCVLCDRDLPAGDNGWTLEIRNSGTVTVIQGKASLHKVGCMECSERMRDYLSYASFVKAGRSGPGMRGIVKNN